MEIFNMDKIVDGVIIGVVVAIMLAIFRLLKRILSKIGKKWWNATKTRYIAALQKWRVRKTKPTMLLHTQNEGIIVPIDLYQNALTGRNRNVFAKYLPNKKWADDGIKIAALEELHREGKVTKAEIMPAPGPSGGWPTRTDRYVFRATEPDIPLEQQEEQIKAESTCLYGDPFKSIWGCTKTGRYEWYTSFERTSPNSTKTITHYRLRPDAPPCSRCWEVADNRQNIRNWTASILNNEMAHLAPSEILQNLKDFIEIVALACADMDSRLNLSFDEVKSVVHQVMESQTPTPPTLEE